MKCSFIDHETKETALEPITDFSVLVAYQGAAGGQHAREFLERMAMALAPEDSDLLPCTMWEFDDQMTRFQIETAAEQAALADVIFIVAREREQVPQVLEEWVDLWLPKK